MFSAAPGHHHKNSALILFRFFPEKVPPKKAGSLPTPNGELILRLRPFITARGQSGHHEFKPPDHRRSRVPIWRGVEPCAALAACAFSKATVWLAMNAVNSSAGTGLLIK